MQQRLLLPSAHTAVLVTDKPNFFEKLDKFKGALFVFGILVVLLGGLDLLNRLPAAEVGNNTLFRAFAPAATLLE